MRILFVSPFLPWPLNIGVALRMRSILKALQMLGDVDCVFFGDETHIRKIPDGAIPRVIKVLPPLEFGSRHIAGRLLSSIPIENREWWLSYLPGFRKLYSLSTELQRQFASISISDYDMAFFVRIPTLWWLDWKSTIPTVVDVDDVQHLGLRKACQQERNILKKTIKKWHSLNVERAEVRTLSQVGRGFVCSNDDVASMRADNIDVLPNIFPDRGQLERAILTTAAPIILFVGALVYKPNREALNYFTEEIFPIIRRNCPKAILRIVGRTGTHQNFPWSGAAGVEFLGTVDDIDSIIETAAIEVCPMLYGLGTRIKILEALSFGKAVVSTSVGAHGIELTEREGLFRADSPETFAKICIELLGDLDRRKLLAPLARAGINTHYGQERVNSVVGAAISKTLASN